MLFDDSRCRRALRFGGLRFTWAKLPLVLAACFVGGFAWPRCHAESESNRPDIVVFLSDDHTFRDASVYGSTEMPTPNMRRLAAAGMTFDRAFVASPSCAPSRAALLTGLYPANNGAEPNHARPQASLPKLPGFLQELGYEVAAFGKVGHYRQTAEYGFDVARHFGYHEDIAIDKAIAWLEARESDKPLCLFVGTNWPHVPWPEDTSAIDREKLRVPPNHVDNETTRRWRARYAAAIAQMDRDLGKVYDAARAKLGDDIFFLHTSDHGAQWPFAKWNLYEDGIRTPLMVSWPGRVAEGVRTEAMVSWIDLLPTLVEAAGGVPPDTIDGKSFMPVLRGATETHRDVILTTHSGDGRHNVFPIRAARSPDGWKYIRNLRPDLLVQTHTTEQRNDGSYWDSWVETAIEDAGARRTVRRYQARPAEELYNVEDDPFEQHNLADDPTHAPRLDSLRRRVDAWMQQTGDPQEIYGAPKKRAGEHQPNLVVIFIDDMGYTDLSCFGGTRSRTENLDRLAAEGIRFQQFYVNSPICSPSRVALTTGFYPQRYRIGSFLNNRRSNRQRGLAQWLDPSVPVLARRLQRSGYFTGHFGKWHMGGQRDVGNAPLITAYGFDRSLTNFEGLGPRVLGIKDAYDGKPTKKHTLGSHKLGRGKITYVDRSVVTKAYVDRALEHIDQAVAKQQPFYINLWPDDVHSPFFPPEPLRKATDESKRELYDAVVEAMDRQLAPLLDRIRNDDRLREETLIVVCSDNGPEPGAGSSEPLRGNKTLLYEGGIRSPLIVWGPGMIDAARAGSINSESYFSAIDLNRSLYSVAGIEPATGVQTDGQDLSETLLGRSTDSRRRPLFFRRPPDRPDVGWGRGRLSEPPADAPDLAVRDGRWKYLVNYEGSMPQLYDLEKDAAETKNMAADHPEVVQRLHVAVMQWNAELPKDAGDPSFQIDPQ